MSATRLERAASGATVAFALVHGGARLVRWTAAGTFPGATSLLDVLPLLHLAALALLLLVARVRQAGAFELALAVLAWAFGVSVSAELPTYAASHWAGEGPALAPVYLLASLAAGLYATGVPRRHAAGERAAALLMFWAAADVRLFQRADGLAFPLFSAAVLLCFARRRQGEGEAGRSAAGGGGGAALAALVAAFLAWWALAAAAGESWRIGVESWGRVATGALLAAYLWAHVRGEDAQRRALGGLLAGLALACVLALTALAELLPYVGWERLLAWRLRLLDTHPNQVAPIFAGGVCLLAPLLALRRGGGLPRLVLAALALVCLALLALARSRASLGGCVLGLLVGLFAVRGRLPSRAVAWIAPLALALALAGAALLSPAGGWLRAELESRTQVQSAVGQRYHFFRMTTAAVREHPWLGLGPTQYAAHARFAEPSFYDGTLQTYHPHNLFLAAAESAGLPGLALFALLCLALLELGRRAVLAARAGPARARNAGLLAACVATLGLNQLDVVPPGSSFVPLILWIAMGLFGASIAGASLAGSPLASAVFARTARTARGHVLRALAALALFVPLVALPLAGEALVDLGDARAARGEPAAAAARYALADRVYPWSQRALRAAARAWEQVGNRQRALAFRQREARAFPSRAHTWYQNGLALLGAGRARPALGALARAQRADPRGPHTGSVAFARAAALLTLERQQDARAALLTGLRAGGDWSVVPTSELAARAGDRPAAGQIVFRSRSGKQTIALAELLAELEREALAEPDETRRRRLVVRLLESYREHGLARRALELIGTYRARYPVTLASIELFELELLGELGDAGGAARAFARLQHKDDARVVAAYVRALATSDDPAHQREVRARDLALVGGPVPDLFFSAGSSAEVFDVAAERALQAGDFAAALRMHRRALFDRRQLSERELAAQRFVQRAAQLGLGDEHLLAALAELVEQCARDPRPERAHPRLRMALRAVRDAWQGAPAELAAATRRLARDAGPSAELLRAELERLLG